MRRLDRGIISHYNGTMSVKDTRGYLGVYGSVALPKSWCESCHAFSFVKEGRGQCCGAIVTGKSERWKRESLASGIRKVPGKLYQQAQLDRQANRCFYCLRQFGDLMRWRKKLRTLIVHWDHLVPFVYLQTNPLENFVAACQICNGIKHSKVFQTVQEARQYVLVQRDFAT